jgi:ABC-type transport system substrate-binding protein
MQQMFKRHLAVFAIIGVMLPILAACGQQAPQVIRETVIVEAPTQPPQVIEQTVVVEATADPAAEVEATEPAANGGEAWTTPHPILSNPEVRQAIAYCSDRSEVIASVYPFLSEEERAGLLMDTFLPQGHWALAPEDEITTYPFDPDQGNALLDAAGWTLDENASVRTNEDGEVLSLSLTTTNAQFRQTWTAVFINQMAENCGVQIVPTYAPASWWFGSSTGLRRRDFELGAFAWVGQPDPGGSTLYSCNQIPLPSNNWNGQNYMGWCNDEASRAIIAANNTLDREQRIAEYTTVQREFTADMVSLPMFNRAEVAAWSSALGNFVPDATDYYTHNAEEWTIEGTDTVVIAFSQEPATMWGLIESAAVQVTAGYLISAVPATTLNYDYQAKALTELPTIDNGGATNEPVTVAEGDLVWNTAGEAVELAEGVEVVNSDGETVTWDGSSELQMNQLTVTFEYVEGITWSDGEPLKAADWELGVSITCNPDAGAVSYTVCESHNGEEGVEVLSDTSYQISYLPGVQWPEYFVYTKSAYPSHQVIETAGPYQGQPLADVPAEDWASLSEIIETPLSTGPYVLTTWEKGQRMIFEANPFYYGEAPQVPNIVIQFVADTNQAVAQLLTGEVDIVGSETLGAGAEVQTVLDAAAGGAAIETEVIASPTWEHIDMNLFIR